MPQIRYKSSGTWSTSSHIRPNHGIFKGPHNTGLPLNWTPSQIIVGQTLSTPDTHYEDVDFVYTGVVVSANNVTFRNCRMTRFTTTGTPTGVVLENCKISYLDVRYATVRFSEISDQYGDLIRAGSEGFVEDCWVHSAYMTYGAHLDAWQTLGMTNGSLVRCRLDFGSQNANACMQFSSGINNLLVEDNYFNGGGYVLSGVPTGSNIEFRGNVWGPNRTWAPTYPGIITGLNVTWGPNNIYEATGLPV